jgi:hypothetical protein
MGQSTMLKAARVNDPSEVEIKWASKVMTESFSVRNWVVSFTLLGNLVQQWYGDASQAAAMKFVSKQSSLW